jgi:hypothetical protein
LTTTSINMTLACRISLRIAAHHAGPLLLCSTTNGTQHARKNQPLVYTLSHPFPRTLPPASTTVSARR